MNLKLVCHHLDTMVSHGGPGEVSQSLLVARDSSGTELVDQRIVW